MIPPNITSHDIQTMITESQKCEQLFLESDAVLHAVPDHFKKMAQDIVDTLFSKRDVITLGGYALATDSFEPAVIEIQPILSLLLEQMLLMKETIIHSSFQMHQFRAVEQRIQKLLTEGSRCDEQKQLLTEERERLNTSLFKSIVPGIHRDGAYWKKQSKITKRILQIGKDLNQLSAQVGAHNKEASEVIEWNGALRVALENKRFDINLLAPETRLLFQKVLNQAKKEHEIFTKQVEKKLFQDSYTIFLDTFEARLTHIAECEEKANLLSMTTALRQHLEAKKEYDRIKVRYDQLQTTLRDKQVELTRQKGVIADNQRNILHYQNEVTRLNHLITEHTKQLNHHRSLKTGYRYVALILLLIAVVIPLIMLAIASSAFLIVSMIGVPVALMTSLCFYVASFFKGLSEKSAQNGIQRATDSVAISQNEINQCAITQVEMDKTLSDMQRDLPSTSSETEQTLLKMNLADDQVKQHLDRARLFFHPLQDKKIDILPHSIPLVPPCS
jgi:hypothetical protein